MKIGIITKHLAKSQCNYETLSQSQVLNSTGAKVSIFAINITSKVMQSHVAVHPLVTVQNFTGDLVIATDFESARFLSKTPINADKMYYVYDLEWMYSPVKYSIVYNSLLPLKLLVRSKDHQSYLKSVFGLSSTVVDYNLEKIWNLRDATKTNLFMPM